MTRPKDPGVLARAQGVAVAVAMPTGPGLDEAIRLAEDLVAAGHDADAIVEVASLPLGSTWRDAEPPVVSMLAELGIVISPANDEASRYRLLLVAFGQWNLPYEDFEGPFYARLVSSDHQDELDRSLVMLMHEMDAVSIPSEREVLQDRMRELVRDLGPV